MPARESLAFDMYGTLVDPIDISRQLELYVPDGAERVAVVWRQKQLEYTFRLTAMEQYIDFEAVTRRALEYALALAGRELNEEQGDALMAAYDDLEPYPDVEPALRRLQQAGYVQAIFSNGTPAMLRATVEGAGLGAYFEDIVSVDEVRAYKPSPRVYRHLAERLGRPLGEVRLVSSNPFDIVGARSAGMQSVWVNRSGEPFDTLGAPPEVIVGSMSELAGILETSLDAQ